MHRLFSVVPLLVALVAALAACGGGDDAPSDQDYFRTMDEADKEVDRQFETLQCDETNTASACAISFGEGVSFAQTKYEGVTPSKDAEEQHEELVAALKELSDRVDALDFQEDDSIDAFYESEAADTTRVDDAFCAIQDLADQKGIEADVGCDTDGGTDEPSTRDKNATPDADTVAKANELLDDADAAAEIVDEFWATHWSDSFTGSYVSPEIDGGYFGSENPTCGGIYADGSGNAYYCPADDYIAWDWELLASNFLDEQIGDSFVYLVIAHEWGHAIQERLDLALVSVDAELQADCLAGATLAGAEADGILLIEPGDRGEIFQSLASVADEVEWGNSQDHGSADERIEAYQLGEAEGVEACLPAE